MHHADVSEWNEVHVQAPKAIVDPSKQQPVSTTFGNESGRHPRFGSGTDGCLQWQLRTHLARSQRLHDELGLSSITNYLLASAVALQRGEVQYSLSIKPVFPEDATLLLHQQGLAC